MPSPLVMIMILLLMILLLSVAWEGADTFDVQSMKSYTIVPWDVWEYASPLLRETLNQGCQLWQVTFHFTHNYVLIIIMAKMTQAILTIKYGCISAQPNSHGISWVNELGSAWLEQCADVAACLAALLRYDLMHENGLQFACWCREHDLNGIVHQSFDSLEPEILVVIQCAH